MSHTLTLEQVSTQLPGLMRSLRPGDEILLSDNDQTVARVVPTAKRVAGGLKGILMIVSEDDEHLEDFKDYMP